MEPVQRRISGDSAVFEKELSDYSFRRWLLSVWERRGGGGGGREEEEKKKKSESERGREESSGWGEGEGRLLLLFEKSRKKLLGALTGRLWGWRRHRGVVPHTSAPICHSLPALSQRVLRLYQCRLETMKWHIYMLTHPEGSNFSPSPPCLYRAFAHFLFPQTTFCFVLLSLGKRWISFCHRRTSEGRPGH